jgi:hypothetical protein
MSRAGVDADIAERCLGHVIGGVRGVYDRHSFLEEKRIAFEKLAALIEGIVNPQENVVPLHKASGRDSNSGVQMTEIRPFRLVDWSGRPGRGNVAMSLTTTDERTVDHGSHHNKGLADRLLARGKSRLLNDMPDL